MEPRVKSRFEMLIAPKEHQMHHRGQLMVVQRILGITRHLTRHMEQRIASMQSTHATSDMRWAEARLGPERVQGAYAWQRFLALAVPVANGSDFPVEEPNPLMGFYAAVTRQDQSGSPEGGWFPDQRMTREEALRSWTVSGAYAAFEEKTKGSLEPGKLADFVMLSGDIMKIPAREIPRTRVRMTVMGGEIVFSE